MKVEIECDWCHKPIIRYPCQIKRHNFCSRECLAMYSNKLKNPRLYADLKDFSEMSRHMTQLNLELNPIRMTDETREKLRKSRLNSGEGKGYTKIYSKAAHRVVAEQKLGRPLYPAEVVHHMDFNPRNNAPDNLMVFSSQSDHARYHAKLYRFFNTGEVDDEIVEEVMPNDVQTT